MKATVLNPAATAALRELADFAARPENLYDLSGAGASVAPGDDPRFVRFIEYAILSARLGLLQGTMRVVFSVTKMGDGKVYRHASFTLSAGDGRPGIHLGGGTNRHDLPAPTAVEAACLCLGYEGAFEDWIVGSHEHDESVIVVAQELR
jgi:hypothetical protein